MKVPMVPPPLDPLFRAATKDERLLEMYRAAGGAPPGYPHWDKVRHLSPPAGLTSEEWWLVIKLGRAGGRNETSLTSIRGDPFGYNVPGELMERLRIIDQRAGGRIALGEQVTNQATRDRYIVSSLIEEAITSSQMEGASTTRRVAKDMLRTGRAPRNRSEQMILNNFRAMQFVRDHAADDLTPDLVLELHRFVTEETLDDPRSAGRLQGESDERVVVSTPLDGTVLHVPPPARDLPRRLKLMCAFANGASPTFVHPVVRAITLHFWLAHDHPFEDGNGRTARALFYWSMLHEGYWLAEFITLSRVLKRAPSKYARAFLYTESDGGDLTYFLLHQTEAIIAAVDELERYLERKVGEVRAAERAMRSGARRFNHRQLALLSHALRNTGATYTMRTHGLSHRVVYETARSDLLELQRSGLLTMSKQGKAFVFSPVRDLGARLSAVGERIREE